MRFEKLLNKIKSEKDEFISFLLGGTVAYIEARRKRRNDAELKPKKNKSWIIIVILLFLLLARCGENDSPTTTKVYPLGDANGDYIVSREDIRIANSVVNKERELTRSQMAGFVERTDIDKNGVVNKKDIERLPDFIMSYVDYENPYLYNEIKMSQLPGWDVSRYPYAIITRGDEITHYYLRLFSHKPVVDGTNLAATGAGSIAFKYMVGEDSGKWIEGDEAYLFTELSIAKYPIIWANFDVVETNGNIHIEASEPVKISDFSTTKPVR